MEPYHLAAYHGNWYLVVALNAVAVSLETFTLTAPRSTSCIRPGSTTGHVHVQLRNQPGGKGTGECDWSSPARCPLAPASGCGTPATECFNNLGHRAFRIVSSSSRNRGKRNGATGAKKATKLVSLPFGLPRPGLMNGSCPRYSTIRGRRGQAGYTLLHSHRLSVLLVSCSFRAACDWRRPREKRRILRYSAKVCGMAATAWLG